MGGRTTTVDLAANVICVSVTSLSPFAIAHMTTAGVGDGGIPAKLSFGPATPNPLRARTTFALDLPVKQRVDVRVFDVHGRVVRTLAAWPFEPGRHSLISYGTVTTTEARASRPGSASPGRRSRAER